MTSPQARTPRSANRYSAQRTLGLFAGIGGLERGLEQAGHETLGLCEIDPAARAVLDARFPDVRKFEDVQILKRVPRGTTLISAGFPCQDLSQAGKAKGLEGTRSSLVGEVFRLLIENDVPNVLLENVPFMLHLARGRALEVILESLESLGYSWAYRVVNSQAFGLPQRRERVYIFASRVIDPRTVLLSDDVGEPDPRAWNKDTAVGFYWTEGRGGLGWAVDAVPTLKNGSTVGIASPPAILLPSGEFVKPGIRDAERMQGFPRDWTQPAETVAKRSVRWRLIGNAVTVDVAKWIGERLGNPGRFEALAVAIRAGDKWPRAAFNCGEGRFSAMSSAWPRHTSSEPLSVFLAHSEAEPLSLRAITGFLQRYEGGTLRKKDRFLRAIKSYQANLQRASGE